MSKMGDWFHDNVEVKSYKDVRFGPRNPLDEYYPLGKTEDPGKPIKITIGPIDDREKPRHRNPYDPRDKQPSGFLIIIAVIVVMTLVSYFGSRLERHFSQPAPTPVETTASPARTAQTTSP